MLFDTAQRGLNSWGCLANGYFGVIPVLVAPLNRGQAGLRHPLLIDVFVTEKYSFYVGFRRGGRTWQGATLVPQWLFEGWL